MSSVTFFNSAKLLEANIAHTLHYTGAHSIQLVILAIPEEGRHQNGGANNFSNGGVGCGAASVGVADAGVAAAASEGGGGGGDAVFNVRGAGAVGFAGVVPAFLGASKFHQYSACQLVPVFLRPLQYQIKIRSSYAVLVIFEQIYIFTYEKCHQTSLMLCNVH